MISTRVSARCRPFSPGSLDSSSTYPVTPSKRTLVNASLCTRNLPGRSNSLNMNCHMRQRKHRIGYILQDFPSVTEQFVAREIAALRAAGLDIHVFALKSADGLPQSPDVTYFSNARVARQIPLLLLLGFIRCRQMRTLIRELRPVCGRLAACACVLRALSLMRHLNRLGISHIHAHFLTMPSLVAFIVSRLSPTTYSVSAHARDVFCPGFTQSAAWFENSEQIFFCNQHAMSTFRRNFPSVQDTKLVLSRHGIDPADFPVAGTPGTKSLVAAGRLVPKKGYMHLLKAILVLKSRGKAPYLKIYGEGPEEAVMREFIALHGLQENVSLRPFLPQKDLIARIAACDVFLHPSVRAPDGDMDGIPNVILEAMASGTPVIAGQVPSLTEVFTSGRNLLLVDPTEHNTLADAIDTLLTDRTLAGNIAHSARHMIENTFDLSTNVEPLASLFSKKAGSRTLVLEGMEATIGGTRTHLRLILDNLPRDIFDIHLVCSTLRTPAFIEDLEHFKETGVNTRVIQMKRRIAPLSDLLAMLAFCRLLTDIRPHVIHLHSSKAGYIGRIAAFICGYRNVFYSPHAFAFLGHTGFPLRHIFVLAERLLAKMTRRIIAVSEAEKEEAVRNLVARPEQVSVAPNCLPPATAPVERSTGQITLIGFLGRLERQKGCDVLLGALGSVIRSHPELSASITGDGSLRRQMEALARRIASPGRIVFEGQTADPGSFLDRVDLLVIPSRWEGNPYTLWEAVRHRTPMLVSDLPVHKEILGADSQCLFANGDPLALERKLEYVLGNTAAFVASLRYDDVERKYSFSNQMETLTDAYLDPYPPVY
ncbi:MAG: hypothetical protein C0404_07290 [Verrucomicrobia bacterium]|nr:hypothetical protein [Verrucomicrobiota bacterium]